MFTFLVQQTKSHLSSQKVQGTGRRDSALAAYKISSPIVHQLCTETYLPEDPQEMARASPWRFRHPES